MAVQKLLELEKTQICDECGDYHYANDLTEENDWFYCSECYEKIFFSCTLCDSVHLREENEENRYGGDYYCEDCFNDTFAYCYECNDVEYQDNMENVEGQYYCSDCFNEHFHNCDSCGETLHKSEVHYPNYSYNGYCESCHREQYANCINCDSETHRDEMRDDLCDSCWSEENAAIRSYSYKPRSEFHGKDRNGLYFGVEVEVENEEDETSCTEMAEMINNDLFYCKEDGSLDYGFEIVTHPMSFDYIQGEGTEILKGMLDKLRRNGFRSWQTETCGIHVHMSKRAIGNLTLYKMLKLFYENQTFIRDLSGRTDHSFEDYSTMSDEHHDDRNTPEQIRIHKAKYKDTSGRFLAINLENSKTVEIRIFRGTLNKASFFRNLEFCHATVEFCKNTSHKKITVENFKKFTEKNKKHYPMFHAWFNTGRRTDRND